MNPQKEMPPKCRQCGDRDKPLCKGCKLRPQLMKSRPLLGRILNWLRKTPRLD